MTFLKSVCFRKYPTLYLLSGGLIPKPMCGLWYGNDIVQGRFLQLVSDTESGWVRTYSNPGTLS